MSVENVRLDVAVVVVLVAVVVLPWLFEMKFDSKSQQDTNRFINYLYQTIQ